MPATWTSPGNSSTARPGAEPAPSPRGPGIDSFRPPGHVGAEPGRLAEFRPPATRFARRRAILEWSPRAARGVLRPTLAPTMGAMVQFRA
jgi:hypothetical protein